MKNDLRNLKILVDTREQKPLKFESYANVEIISQCIKAGDYSLDGFNNSADINSIIFERKKDCWELSRNLGAYWERFKEELSVLSTYKHKFIVVGSLNNFDALYASGKIKVHPNFIRKRLIEIHLDYGVPVLFFENRIKLEEFVYFSFYKLIKDVEDAGK